MTNKSFLESLGIGQKLRGRVESIPRIFSLLINIEGHFITVENRSTRFFKIGEEVELIVETLNPVQLRIVAPRKSQNLDMSV